MVLIIRPGISKRPKLKEQEVMEVQPTEVIGEGLTNMDLPLPPVDVIKKLPRKRVRNNIKLIL